MPPKKRVKRRVVSSVKVRKGPRKSSFSDNIKVVPRKRTAGGNIRVVSRKKTTRKKK